ncbi:MAG: hypothetical protein SF029_07265 [bacterium]|nr:hypothetical protein [bacterium]
MLSPQEEYQLLVEAALEQNPAQLPRPADDEEDYGTVTGGRWRRILLILITLLILASFVAWEIAPILEGRPNPVPVFPDPTRYPSL